MTRAFCQRIVRTAAAIVPARQRRRWRDEWLAEVDYSWRTPPAPARRWHLTTRASQSIRHAAWLRRQTFFTETLTMNGIKLDLALAARALRRQPGFALVAVLTIALGVGANVSILGVIRGTLLTDLPFGHPDALMHVWETLPSQGVMENTPAPATVELWQARSGLAESFAPYSSAVVNVTGDGEAERLRALRASAALLPTLELAPAIGRNFTADEDRFGGPRAVLLAYDFWVRRYHADPAIVGRQIRLDGESTTVVGVLPDRVRMALANVDVWVPLALKPTENRQSRMLWVVARAKPGVTAAALQQELDVAMHREGPGQMDPGIGVFVASMDQQLRGRVRPDLLLVFGVSAIVLVMACGNVGMMLFVRGLARRQELAIRVAVGADRWRLARLLLAESLVLGAAGGAAGYLVGALALRVIAVLLPASLRGTVVVHQDARLFAVALALAVLAAAVAALAPMLGGTLAVSNARGVDTLERGRAAWLRGALVSAQMALAVVLLSATALLGRTFATIVLAPMGFDAHGVLTAQVPRADTDDARRTAFYEQLVDRLNAAPGVTGAALINGLPMRFSGGGSGFFPDGAPQPVAGRHRIVSPGYFGVMGIPLVSGRDFAASDRLGTAPVVVVSEAFANAAWPDGRAIGRRLRWGADSQWFEVAGVVRDVHLTRGDTVTPHVYFTYQQVQYPFYMPSDVVIRTAAAPGTFALELRAIVHAIDADQPVANVLTMDELAARSVGARRFTLSLMSAFAGLALALSAIGLYGMQSFGVTRRRREFGVRAALGATSARLRRGVLAQGLRLTIAGGAVGISLTYWAARGFRAVVPGLASLGGWAVAAAFGVLVAVAAIACDIPARRAAKADPMRALSD